VLRGEISPDEHLTVGRIAQRLGMSPTPVREAIRTLQAEGLISQQAHHSFSVNGLSAKDVHDIFQLRASLESLVTKLAVPHLTNADLEKLEALRLAIEEAHARGEIPQANQLNRDWHLKLYSVADNRVLFDVIVYLWKKFMWEVDWIRSGHAPRSMFQHAELMTALRARDAEQAGRLMEAHIHSGEEVAMEYLQTLRNGLEGEREHNGNLA
jgi:DNA-binding GntR family transcriptional regulator